MRSNRSMIVWMIRITGLKDLLMKFILEDEKLQNMQSKSYKKEYHDSFPESLKTDSIYS